VAIVNALQLEATRATLALSHFNYDSMPSLSLMSLNLSIAVLLTLNICSVLSVTRRNSVPNINAIEHTAAELLRFQCLTSWPWICFKCCARLWTIFHQVWPSTTYPCMNYSIFWCWYVMSTCDLDLWPVDLKSLRYIKCHRDQSLYEIWAKSSNPGLNYW